MSALLDLLTEGRCLADITHRDDGHRMSICVLPKGHTTAHDDALGCTWTDADHWQPSERDDLAARVARVEALADEYESLAYNCERASDCPICVTYQGVVIGMRRAIRGESE